MRLLALLSLAALTACSAVDMSTVDGIVTAVNGDLTTVESFDVLTTEGDTIRFVPAPFGDFDFPLPHLSSHMRSIEPVRVTYQATDDGFNLAEKISDAPIGGSP